MHTCGQAQEQVLKKNEKKKHQHAHMYKLTENTCKWLDDHTAHLCSKKSLTFTSHMTITEMNLKTVVWLPL